MPIYVFYADIYLLQNFCMDYIALMCVNYFLKRKKGKCRMLLISFFASVLSLLIHIYIRDTMARAIIIHFFLNTAMTFAAFGWHGKCRFLENWFFLYLVILFLGGIMQWEHSMGITQAYFLIKMSVAAILLTIVTVFFSSKKEIMNRIYAVKIQHHGKEFELTGYWDSGNLLLDPYNGQPVNILQSRAARQIFSAQEDYMRLVPYCSLGNKNGLLSVYNAEKMYIYQEKTCFEVAPAVFGVAEAGLLENKEYDVILQASMLERER